MITRKKAKEQQEDMLHEEWGFNRTRKIGKEKERYKARREQ